MRIEITETMWLDEHHEYSLTELVNLSGLSQPELLHLIECEALLPTGNESADARFGADSLEIARTAHRLRNDFDLDTDGLALALRLLIRIRDLETQLRELQAQVPRQARGNSLY